MFLLTFFLWWTIVVPLAMFLVSIIEGVMYLTKSDEEFQRIYVQSQKDWFWYIEPGSLGLSRQ